MLLSEYPAIKLKVLNFIRSNPGYSAEIISHTINIPVLIIHKAIADLKQEGFLDLGPTLKTIRKR